MNNKLNFKKNQSIKPGALRQRAAAFLILSAVIGANLFFFPLAQKTGAEGVSKIPALEKSAAPGSSQIQTPLYFEEQKRDGKTSYAFQGRGYSVGISRSEANWQLQSSSSNSNPNRMAELQRCYDLAAPETDQKQYQDSRLAPQSAPIVLAAPTGETVKNEKPLTLQEKQTKGRECLDAAVAKYDSESSSGVSEFKNILMKIVGANPDAELGGADELAGKVNRYQGTESEWQTALRTFGKVESKNVYAGVDAVYHLSAGAFEYDFVVAPAADPNQIKLEFDGADQIKIDKKSGDLIVKVGREELRQHKPVVYQTIDGEQRKIEGRFALLGKRGVKFEIGDYDKSKTLVIDPTVIFATYLGGSGADNMTQFVDPDGSVTSYGFANSPGAPTGGANPRPAAGGTDFYIAKISPTGQLIFATYYGGSGAESGGAQQINPLGNVVNNGAELDLLLVGTTDSTNLPTTAGAGQTTFGGGLDGFLARIDRTNGNLVFSTYLGGSGNENLFSVNLNYVAQDLNHGYLAGTTTSTNFPTVNAPQPNFSGGVDDGFVGRINLSTGAFPYLTYAGGSTSATGEDNINLSRVDASGNATFQGIVGGATSFPRSPNAFQTAYGGGRTDLLFFTLTPNGGVVKSTYFGGNGTETIFNDFSLFFLANSTRFYFTGQTDSTNFPRISAAQAGFGGGTDKFAIALTSDFTPIYSTTIGGSDFDGLNFLPIVDTGQVEPSVLLYGTISPPDATPADNFPTLNAAQTGFGGGTADYAVAKLNANGALVFASYFGGTGNEQALSIGFDNANGFTVGGLTFYGRITAPDATTADNFTATAGAGQAAYGGGATDAVFVRYGADNQLTGATYLGGSADEISFSPNIDNTAQPVYYYAGGATASTNFPTVNAGQTTYGGGAQDVFAVRFNPNGSFAFSTYLGGSGTDTGTTAPFNFFRYSNRSMVIAGNVTPGTVFPVSPNAVQTGFGGGTTDYYLTKLAPEGALEVSTYFGGTGNESGALLPAFTANGDFGESGSLTTPDSSPADNFKPTPGAGQTTFGGGTSDAFTFFYTASNQLKYATYIGGTGAETGGTSFFPNAHLAQGSTSAGGYPTTANAIQSTYGGGTSDAVFTRINPNNGSFVYSTYLGGNGTDSGFGTPDALGNIFITGTTTSTNLPILNAFQTGYGGGAIFDNFYGKINADGSLKFLSYLGGSDANFAFDNTRYVFSRGRVYIIGAITAPDATPADNFQPVNAVQPTFGGGTRDNVVIRLDETYVANINQNSNADFDGDGRADFAVFRSGVWFVRQSSGIGRSATAPQADYGVQFGQAGDKLAPADYDGDGKTDIAVWRAGDLAYFYVLNSSNNTFRFEQFGKTGDNPSVVGDWDADGKADLAVYRLGSQGGESFFFYRPSSQPSVNFVPVQWGTAGDEAVRGDFDGDGRLDAAVYRPSNNVWYIRQSSTSQLRAEQWGLSTDKRVAGDFDADGRTDLAIYRNGLWAILQSANNQPRYDSFGLAGDQAAAADYDGDGRTDLAVFRSGVFYVKQSSTSNTSAQQFGAAGDVPIASAFVQ